MVLTGDYTQLQIINLKCDSDGSFGFGIVGGTSTGVVIKTIIPGSVADKDKRLCPGDHILKISNINVHGMSSQQVATLLRQQNDVVQLVVGRSISSTLVADTLQNEESIEQSPDIWTMPTKSVIFGTSLENEINNRLALVNKYNNNKVDNKYNSNTNNALISPSNDSSSVSHLRNESNNSQITNVGNHDITVITEEEQSDINKTSYNQSSSFQLKNDNTYSLTNTTTSNNKIKDLDKLSPAEGINNYKNKNDISYNTTSANVLLNEGCISNVEEDNKTSKINNIETFSYQKLKLSAEDEKALAGKNIASHISKLLGDSDVKANTISKKLPSKAMKYFHRDQWIAGQYEEVEVEIERNPVSGLGITVAGYVHREEEINGVFVKSLVKDSSAAISKKIKVHDLIAFVNGVDCQNLSHAESVKLLVNSGPIVKLKLIRFSQESPQAKCLKMLQEQENNAKMADIQANLVKAKTYWQERLGTDFEILTVTLIPDKYDDGGLGISIEGTVDVIDGNQLCPHHYIECLRKDGPAAKSGCLKTGDELLQLNDKILYGESHITVRRVIGKVRNEFKASYLVVARKATLSYEFDKLLSGCLPEAYNLLANLNDDQIVKAKSETQLLNLNENEFYVRPALIRSQSLQYTSGLAIWNCVPLVVTINKDSKGLGFSICDYNDPRHPNETFIVIRSLVPGGVAQADGRIVPGDRLMFVNSEDLSNCSLVKAVEILKSAPFGPVRLGIAKPVPVEYSNKINHLPLISRSERLLAKSNSPRVGRRSYKKHLHFDNNNLPSNALSYDDVNTTEYNSRTTNTPQYYTYSDYYDRLHYGRYGFNLDDYKLSLGSSPSSSRSISPCFSPSARGSLYENESYLPPTLERTIRILKGPTPLGIIFDAEVDKSINGCVVKYIHPKMAIAKDGRIQVGDYIIRINSEKFRNATSAQAKIMLKRLNYIGNQVTVTYITSADAKLWKEKYGQEVDNRIPMINRLSPKVFPKFYQSPFMNNNKELNNLCATETNSVTSIISDNQFDITKSECQTTQALMSNSPINKIINTVDNSKNILNNSKNCKDILLLDNLNDTVANNNLFIKNDSNNMNYINNNSISIFADNLVKNILNELFNINDNYPTKNEEVISPLSSKSNDFDLDYEISELTKTYDKANHVIQELRRDYSLSYLESRASYNSLKEIISPSEICETSSPIKNIGSPTSQLSNLSIGVVPSNQKQSSTENLYKSYIESFSNNSITTSNSINKINERDNMSNYEKNIGYIKNVSINDNAVSTSFEKKIPLSTQSSIDNEMRTLKDEVNIYKNIDEMSGQFDGKNKNIDNNITPTNKINVKHDEKEPLISTNDKNINNSIQSYLINDNVDKSENTSNAMYLQENENCKMKKDENLDKQNMILSNISEFDDKEAEITSNDSKKINTSQLMRSRFWGPPRNVILSKEPNKSFGISIVGGKIEVSQQGSCPNLANTVSGIFIKSVLPDSPAGNSNALHMGDRILSVNDIDLKDATHEYAVKVIKNAINPVKFCVQSLQTFSPQNFKNRLNASMNKELIFHNPPDETSTNDDVVFKQIVKPPTSQTNVIKSAKLIEPPKESITTTKIREKDSAASLDKLPSDMEDEDIFGYTNDKVYRKYKDLPGKPIIIRIKNIPAGGIDLSLSETNEDNTKKSIFIMGITSPSSLSLENGDELLEINGHVLLQMNRKQAQEKIQQCMKDAELSLIILRYKELLKEDNYQDIESQNICDNIEKNKISCSDIKEPQESFIQSNISNLISEDNILIKDSISSKMAEKHAPIETGKETLIEIDKDGKGLGLSIVGGSDTVLGTVVIHEVYTDGAAAMDGRLKPGDQVLEVNDISLRGVSHDHAISLLRRTPSRVRLLIYRDVNLQHSLLDPTQIYNIFNVELTKKPGRGLGISIVGRKNEPGVYVSEIVAGGAAEQDGRLMQGDQILAVNNQDVTSLMQEELATLLKTCNGVVNLKIGRWKLTETTNRVHAATPPTYGVSKNNKSKQNNEVKKEEKKPSDNINYFTNHNERSDVPPPCPQSRNNIGTVPLNDENNQLSPIIHKDLSPVTEEPSICVEGKSTIEDDDNKPIQLISSIHEEGSEDLLIELKKIPDQQLGMGIGKRSRGILVTSLQPGSTAAEKLKVGDRLMAVNGQKVTDQLSAVTFVKASGERLFLQIARPKR
uniref:Inactivation-no-after-D protein n=2 Tax=Strongyloides stercoralis TaxID=6248 RepID=A0A913I068_STRER